jgi:hypothetical protein
MGAVMVGLVQVGSHNHFVNQKGDLIQVQADECDKEAGYFCPTLAHQCDGKHNTIRTMD